MTAYKELTNQYGKLWGNIFKFARALAYGTFFLFPFMGVGMYTETNHPIVYGSIHGILNIFILFAILGQFVSEIGEKTSLLYNTVSIFLMVFIGVLVVRVVQNYFLPINIQNIVFDFNVLLKMSIEYLPVAIFLGLLNMIYQLIFNFICMKKSFKTIHAEHEK
ncbi:hypothetical protein [Sulfurospirillum sp. MES]|uniref:hypothetical protein n=1 Tax=Sulfurospirillum sp. MES TaxID=1565314 RepID=UPI00054237A9|nr:hypothetical protein [Sulfurospirillum sp. MES]KHG34445.1 MAG: hypothetical protein OA34_04955 [Sulfurospirillum sp. MES]